MISFLQLHLLLRTELLSVDGPPFCSSTSCLWTHLLILHGSAVYNAQRHHFCVQTSCLWTDLIFCCTDLVYRFRRLTFFSCTDFVSVDMLSILIACCLLCCVHVPHLPSSFHAWISICIITFVSCDIFPSALLDHISAYRRTIGLEAFPWGLSISISRFSNAVAQNLQFVMILHIFVPDDLMTQRTQLQQNKKKHKKTFVDRCGAPCPSLRFQSVCYRSGLKGRYLDLVEFPLTSTASTLVH